MKWSMRQLSLSFVAAAFVMVAVVPSPSLGKEAHTLHEAVSQSVLSNPDIQEKWHAFQAAGSAVEAGEAGFGPRLDLTAGVGRDSIDGKGYEDRDFSDYDHHGIAVTLRQMICDGGLTHSQVNRLGHVRMVRYYDLLSSIESVSLETVRAYADVVRYRDLLELAQENLNRHEEVMNQVRDRVEKGYDSRASLEEIRGRVAVARVNLLTEQANLHDVSARYERIVGEPPADNLLPFTGSLPIPSCADKALQRALSGNPSLFAARENVLAAESSVEEKKAAFRPRVDLRGGYKSDHDLDGVDGRKDKWYGELVMTYNIYDSGARKAALEQHEELLMQSGQRLEVTGREIRQTLKVSYNDLFMLQDQMPFLTEHVKASNEVRKAYDQQFRIGRRTLLDLLDSENEYYQASRALHNAEFNISIAHVRVLASMGELTRAFGVKRDDVPSLEDLDVDPSRYEFGPKHEKLGIDCLCAATVEGEEQHYGERSAWMLQVGSYTYRETADEMLEKLAEQGFHAEVCPAVLEGKTWYRLRVPGGDSRQQALQIQQSLKSQGYSSLLISNTQ